MSDIYGQPMSNQDKRKMRWAVRFITQSGLCYKPSGAKKMKPISHLWSLVFWKESWLHPAAHSTSCKPYSEGMCGRAPSPRQTAACLSQVIFVKQLLSSNFFSSRNYHHYMASNTKQPIWAKDIVRVFTDSQNVSWSVTGSKMNRFKFG